MCVRFKSYIHIYVYKTVVSSLHVSVSINVVDAAWSIPIEEGGQKKVDPLIYRGLSVPRALSLPIIPDIVSNHARLSSRPRISFAILLHSRLGVPSWLLLTYEIPPCFRISKTNLLDHMVPVGRATLSVLPSSPPPISRMSFTSPSTPPADWTRPQKS